MTLSWLIALSQLGVVLAGTPLAAATDMVGWRFSFVAMGLVAMLVGYLFLQVVHDRAAGRGGCRARSPATRIGALAGLRQVVVDARVWCRCSACSWSRTPRW